MGERSSHPPGTLAWADLATPDAEAAKAFYAGLFGWEIEELPGGGAALCRIGGRAVAAIAGQEVAPKWNLYATVEDADAAAAQVTELGGSLMGPPFDVADSGRIAGLTDPTGAALALWQPRTHPGAGLVNAPGALSWADCVTPDPRAALAFYCGLFGWREQRVSEDPAYWVLFNGERTTGGLMELGSLHTGAPHWLTYFGSDAVEVSVSAAEAAGGRLLAGPIQVPQGRFAVLQDPQGARFAVVQGEFDD